MSRFITTLLPLLWLSGSTCRPQHFPAEIIEADPRAPFSLRRIESVKERSAAQLLLHQSRPGRRLELAERFLKDHQDSWFVGEALEIAAKASLQNGQYRKAVAYAQKSLRLLPENPSLLIAVAWAHLCLEEWHQAGTAGAEAVVHLREQTVPPPGWRGDQWRNWQDRHLFLARLAHARAGVQQLAEPPADAARLEAAVNSMHELLQADPVASVHLYLSRPPGIARSQGMVAAVLYPPFAG